MVDSIMDDRSGGDVEPAGSSPNTVEKQTARDDESGETSHNAQERMASITSDSARVIKEETPSESDHALQLERMNDSWEKDTKAGMSKYDIQQKSQRKSHYIQFRFKHNEYAVTCDTSMTVFEALNTSNIFKNIKKKNMKKEMVIQRPKGQVPRAAVKTDFPCCLIQSDEILNITFINKDGNASAEHKPTVDISNPDSFVTFYIHTTGGETVKLLMKNKNLRLNVDDVCVYAFKGEDFLTALSRDGRFIDDIFKKIYALCEMDSEKIHEMSNDVKHFSQMHFKVIFISDIDQPDTQNVLDTTKTESDSVASTSTLTENVDPSLQLPINNEKEKTRRRKRPQKKKGPKREIQNSKEILGILRAQFKGLMETVKKRENLKKNPEVLKFFREEYHKSVENFSEVKKVKQLMRLSDSVCQIRVGGGAVGTGFLLFDRFILTNAHVIGISTELTPENVAQYTAVFDYEDMDLKVKRIPVKQLIAFCYGKADGGMHLDYALLELDSGDEIAESPKIDSAKEIAVYPELLSSYSPNPPNKGHICILGHPGEGVKKMDPCFIIERENRLKAADKNASVNKHLIHVMMEVYKEQKWDFSAHENKFTYDSCFFHGSSGSPVFDEHCKLIGVHTGGYKYNEEGTKTRSVMEYGFTMQPILESISAQAKIKGLHEIVNALKPYISKSKSSEDQQNSTDCEMVDAEQS
ncbi:protein FAM111A [Pimephales promelas]|nr:protein FAM111A [Pimephales promelas]